MANKRLPLGTSDFKVLIDEQLYYVDKTNLIAEIIDGGRITLLPRPRRFGKTLNMSMLSYFFSNQSQNGHPGYRHLFKDLEIEQNATAMTHCGQYPVIFLSFKDIKERSEEDTYCKIADLIATQYDHYSEVLSNLNLSERESQTVQSIRTLSATTVELSNSIRLLSALLQRYFQQPVIIIVDEYDMPINSAYTYGYYDSLVIFLRNLLSGAFKDNPYVFKGIMTGILRVAQESIFSGLNNVDVCTLNNPRYSSYFGFTEPETLKLMEDYELTRNIDSIRQWYNGYNFGERIIYNPWSIISLLQNNGMLSPYWLNTSDNALVKDLIGRASMRVKQDLEHLMLGTNNTISKPLNENIVFRNLDEDEDAIWNFLLFSGYLRYTNISTDVMVGETHVELSIPNQEVRFFYTRAILSWFKPNPATNAPQLPTLLNLLLQCDFASFNKAFTHFCQATFSYFDIQGKQPERFYHAFVLGMLVQLQASHTIKSNRESGYGRYDVCIIPKDKSQPGFVFEFKSVDAMDNLTLEQACQAAMEQIEQQNYKSEIMEQGIKQVHSIAIAFAGKQVLVQTSSTTA
ncbi:MAG: AAA family ATPase [Kangiellaceae bacterium]|nr:AAA family ATPase [Kangiellaceae bacterium]